MASAIRFPDARSSVWGSGGGDGEAVGLGLGLGLGLELRLGLGFGASSGLGGGAIGDGAGEGLARLNVAASHAPVAPHTLKGPWRAADSTGR
jgi:hypothetical protein